MHGNHVLRMREVSVCGRLGSDHSGGWNLGGQWATSEPGGQPVCPWGGRATLLALVIRGLAPPSDRVPNGGGATTEEASGAQKPQRWTAGRSNLSWKAGMAGGERHDWPKKAHLPGGQCRGGVRPLSASGEGKQPRLFREKVGRGSGGGDLLTHANKK